MKMLSGRKKRNDGPGEWLLTYSDMVTLLLTFFVLLYSYSRTDLVRFQQALASFRKALAMTWTETEMAQQISNHSRTTGDISDDKLAAEVRGLLQKDALSEKISVAADQRGVVIRLKEQVLFDLGRAELRPEALSVLGKIAAALNEVSDREIRVEGHTDDLPINTVVYPSNWELSAARAAAVVKYFVNECGLSPERFEIAGFGEFRPAYPNSTPDLRRLNRRVEIVLRKRT